MKPLNEEVPALKIYLASKWKALNNAYEVLCSLPCFFLSFHSSKIKVSFSEGVFLKEPVRKNQLVRCAIYLLKIFRRPLHKIFFLRFKSIRWYLRYVFSEICLYKVHFFIRKELSPRSQMFIIKIISLITQQPKFAEYCPV